MSDVTPTGGLLNLSVLGVVLSLGGTPDEADAVLSRLSRETLPASPSVAHAQVVTALEAVRGERS